MYIDTETLITTIYFIVDNWYLAEGHEYLKHKAGKKPVRVIVQHADAREEAEHIKERVEKEFSCSELYLTEFSPVMGYATGPGTLVLSFTDDE